MNNRKGFANGLRNIGGNNRKEKGNTKVQDAFEDIIKSKEFKKVLELNKEIYNCSTPDDVYEQLSLQLTVKLNEIIKGTKGTKGLNIFDRRALDKLINDYLYKEGEKLYPQYKKPVMKGRDEK